MIYGTPNCHAVSRVLRALAMVGCMAGALVVGNEISAVAEWTSLGVTYTGDPEGTQKAAATLDGTTISVTATATYNAKGGDPCPETCNIVFIDADQSWRYKPDIPDFVDPRIRLDVTQHVDGIANGVALINAQGQAVTNGGIHASAHSMAEQNFVGTRKPPGKTRATKGKTSAGTPSYKDDFECVVTDNTDDAAGQPTNSYEADGVVSANASAGNAVDGNDPPVQLEDGTWGELAGSNATAHASIPAVIAGDV